MILDVDPLQDHRTNGYHQQVTTINPNFNVINGSFDTDTDWDKSGNWAITGGVATLGSITGNSGDLSPTIALDIKIGYSYVIRFDLSVGGDSYLRPSLGGITFDDIYVDGSYALFCVATATTDLNFYGIIGSGKPKILTLDNVEVLELGSIRGDFIMPHALLTGNIELGADGSSDIGSDGLGLRRIFLGEPSGGYNLPDFRGLVASYAGGDMYIGNDNCFPGYYVQKTVVHGSTKNDNTDDYTNLYQGDFNYQRLSMMYTIEYSASPLNGVEIGAATTNPPPLMFGTNGAFRLRYDGSNNKMIIQGDSGSVPFLEIGLNHITEQEAVRPNTDDKIDLGDYTNNLRWRSGYFTQLADSLVGFSVNGTQVITSQQSGIADAIVAHDLNVVYSDTEVEGALDALGGKINAIINALEAHGLIATI